MSKVKTYPTKENRDDDDSIVKVYAMEDLSPYLTYNYSNYLNWFFDDRVELIRGKVSKMSPAPTRLHQEISIRIASRLFHFLERNPCKVYTAPFDVRFAKRDTSDRDVSTVLQPDICVVCDLSKLDDRGCLGAPDIVVEILSPGNSKKELVDKYKIYQEYGVKEYWIVSPVEQTFLIYTLDESGTFTPSKLMTSGDEVASLVLPGFVLQLEDLFAPR